MINSARSFLIIAPVTVLIYLFLIRKVEFRAEWTRSNSMVGVKTAYQFPCCNIYFYGRIFYKAGKSKC